MAFVVNAIIGTLLEIDEMTYLVTDDEVIVKFVTTGIMPELAELKTKIWALIGLPPKTCRVESVEEVQKGPLGITKRYVIDARFPKKGFRLKEGMAGQRIEVLERLREKIRLRRRF